MFLISSAFSVHSQELDRYQWKFRVLVIRDSSQNNVHYLRNRFLPVKDDIEERDLLLFFCSPVGGSTMEGETIAFPCTEFPYGITLVGKDGGIKLKGNLDTPAQVIFERIDSMPMRKAEMRNPED